jgi:6-phosphogluconolactonase
VSPVTVFVGGYSSEHLPGIFAFALDEASGGLCLQGGFDGIRNPSFLALHPGGRFLFAVSEIGAGRDDAPGAVHALRIDGEPGSLQLVSLNHRSTDGDDPCHLALDGTGRWLAVSNYGSGSVAVFPILADGRLGERASSVRHAGSGPNTQRQEGPHAHSALFLPGDRFLVAADLGIDRLVVYAFDGDTGAPALHDEIEAAPGAGPRHMALHPGQRHLFVVNELESSVTAYVCDPGSGRLRALQSVSTVPRGVPDNTAADIHVSPSGRHVYVSNRGHDSIAVFAFDPSGCLTRVAVRPSGGRWPRGFGIGPGGRHLVVANQHSDEVALLPLVAGGSDVGRPLVRAAVARPSNVAFLDGPRSAG